MGLPADVPRTRAKSLPNRTLDAALAERYPAGSRDHRDPRWGGDCDGRFASLVHRSGSPCP